MLAGFETTYVVKVFSVKSRADFVRAAAGSLWNY